MGVDLIAQAESGVMSVTGLAEGGALPVGVAIADALGGINLAFAVVAALFARSHTGRGQSVQVSLVGGLLGLQAWEIQRHLLSGAVRRGAAARIHWSRRCGRPLRRATATSSWPR